MQTRYYDPTVRRFLNADSLFIAGDEITGANMYAYCNGNPVMMCDPSGMESGMLEAWRAVGVALALCIFVVCLPEPLQQPAFAALLKTVEMLNIDSAIDMINEMIMVAECIYGEDRSSPEGSKTFAKFLWLQTQNGRHNNLYDAVQSGEFTGYNGENGKKGVLSSGNYNNSEMIPCIGYATLIVLAQALNSPVLVNGLSSKITNQNQNRAAYYLDDPKKFRNVNLKSGTAEYYSKSAGGWLSVSSLVEVGDNVYFYHSYYD